LFGDILVRRNPATARQWLILGKYDALHVMFQAFPLRIASRMFLT